MASDAEPGMAYAYCVANDGCVLAFQTSRPTNRDSHQQQPSLPFPAATLAANSEGGETEDAEEEICILLLHGFSGSSRYFTRNYPGLTASRHWVVAADLRGHGNSGRPAGGYHVARLAADLRDLVAHLRWVYSAAAPPSSTHAGTENRERKRLKFVPVGCSIGAAVVWTYVELFGSDDDDFAGYVFADQAPLQDRSAFGDYFLYDSDDSGDGNRGEAKSGEAKRGRGWDASRAHLSCYDEATLQAAQAAWAADPEAAGRELAASCLGYRHAPEAGDGAGADADADAAFFAAISARCDGAWLARLLADHTRYDHREALEALAAPALVLAGRRTGCFPLAGMREVAARVEHASGAGRARLVLFGSGHWMFYEEPDRFNTEVLAFVESCRARPRVRPPEEGR
ncbi:alpha/beta-hydrolase [Durotheca rogersii]|uniref:alpha/beta-hydrolase n=1 Tax=Durotheca rogersii TaxID=419775 RepID=UPI00221FCE96|nr:alpha/beta-hydrolase [Durotheca rogersii]KAI5866281.1 alpha/beta-hydrolase [Durotheca rogersii]